jgi:16S rRNA (uracil1498-N3)-methyltransferase
MDWVIQKAAELGASTIVPIQSRHSIVQLKPERIETQLARWRRIVLEAAQQSEQWSVPTVAPPTSLAALLTGRKPGTTTLLLAERQQGKSLQRVELPSDHTCPVLVLIGPEGGWSREEMDLAAQAGCEFMTLGRHILRAETAAVAALSILQSRLGNLD